MLSWERQRLLNDHLLYLKDVERARNFSWDDWRKRVSILTHNFLATEYLCLFRYSLKVPEVHEPQEVALDGSVP